MFRKTTEPDPRDAHISYLQEQLSRLLLQLQAERNAHRNEIQAMLTRFGVLGTPPLPEHRPEPELKNTRLVYDEVTGEPVEVSESEE